MDKVQAKMVELTDNLPALEVCLLNGLIEYSDLILFLQYDIPIEESSKEYAKLKECLCERHNATRYTTDERCEVLSGILHRLQAFIIRIDKNGSQSRVVYKKANDMAEQICARLNEKRKIIPANTKFVHYSEKAAQ